MAVAKKEKTKNPAPAKKKEKKKGFFKSLISFFKDTRVHKTFGLFLCLFSVFLLVSFISYFFSGKQDDSLPYDNLYNLFFGKDIAFNWMGKVGAFFSDMFIKRWLGVASLGFILLFFVTGLRLFLNFRLLPLRKTFSHSLFWVLWLSTTFGFIFYYSLTFPQNILGGVFVNRSRRGL